MVRLDFINVGYGDAVLIRDTEAPFAMLVDCGDVTVGDGGEGSRRISAAEFLEQEQVRTLDLLVLTHLHRDHSGGLARLLQSTAVREFWCNYLPPRAYWGREVPVPADFSAGARSLLESLNICLAALAVLDRGGTRIRSAEELGPARELTPSLRAEIHLEDAALRRRQAEIWQRVLTGRPRCGELEELDGFINNTSIRLRLESAGRSAELPGDVYAACWQEHDLRPCTVVKLPHHGHGDSLTPRLLGMLRPAYTVISVSNTRTDNCPAAEVVRLVRSGGGRLLFTDAVAEGGLAPPPHQAVGLCIRADGTVTETVPCPARAGAVHPKE
jgi:competence protein ComEC